MCRTCHGCQGQTFHYEEANLRCCSGCKRVYYCSTHCQEDDWVEHKFVCNPGRYPITTADHLALAVRQDMFPGNRQTCEDYGFNRVHTDDEETNLLGLYIGMLIHLLMRSSQRAYRPHQNLEDSSQDHSQMACSWSVVDKIKATYYKIPEDRRGEYFPWFLRNEHILAPGGQSSSTSAQASQAMPVELSGVHVDAAVVTAWRFIGGSESDSAEEIKAALARKLDGERNCFGYMCSC